MLKRHPFYWERKLWQPRDVFYERNGNRFSCDVRLAKDTEKFLLVKDGFKKDRCVACGWELFGTDNLSHGVGFTDGAVWVCEECYRYFVAGNFFCFTYSDIT